MKLLDQEFYGLPDRFWLLDIESMGAVTRVDVLVVARHQIPPQCSAFVVLAGFES